MKKESFTSFMKQVAADLQQSGNLGTAHVYRSSLNAILTFQGSGCLSRFLFFRNRKAWSFGK